MTAPAEVWVMDASPLILLGKVGLLPLVPRLTIGVDIPDIVIAEVSAKQEDATRAALAELRRDARVRVYTLPTPAHIAGHDLGDGETAALAMAVGLMTTHSGPLRVVTDDAEARRAARSLGIPTIGTLGVLVRLKDAGQVEAIVPCLHRLVAAGMWIDDTLCRTVAVGAGEVWP